MRNRDENMRHLLREILFRGKRLDDGEWVEGSLLQCGENAYIFVGKGPDFPYDFRAHKVDTATVGQYTGLTDKHGKRIFEGDIVKVKHGYCGNPNYPTKDVAEVVEYNQKSCCYEFYRWSGDIYDLEIIGNIHDNPELLGGGS